MITFEMEDLIGVLQGLTPYFIAIAVALAAAIAVTVLVKKQPRAFRSFLRGETWMAFLLVLCIIVNLICLGPMSALLSLVGGAGTETATVVSDALAAEAIESAKNIAREGFVLLENEGILPLTGTKKLNLFGWASTNPVYGGAGSGGINDLYEKISLIDSLKNAGFEVNEELVNFYLGFAENRAAVSITAQNWNLPEPPVKNYSDSLISNAKSFSDTAVIVISRLAGEGHNDIPQNMAECEIYTDNSEDYRDWNEGDHYLQLNNTEKAMVELVCNNFENVVVVYNGAYAFELGFCEDYPEIKGVIWAAGPGNVGFAALGEIMNGEVNPSGRTNDTFVYKMSEAPYFNNAEKYDYANMTHMTVDGMNAGVPTQYAPSFINYVEGIYVGYRFYETAAKEGVIDYDATVQYPFGYGLSYTTFTQKMSDLRVNGTEISFDVTVTNTGDKAGKDVVEVYFDPPYTDGGIEKASANLVRYDKTRLLKPGESQTITVKLDEEDMASFDDLGAGAYVLEKGDYVISVNADSHRVLDSKVYTVANTITYSGDNGRKSDDKTATAVLGDARGDVEYLSRKGGFANLAAATAVPSDLNMAEKYIAGYHLNQNYDPTKYINPADTMPTTGAKNGVMLIDLRGKAYDDPMWDKLLDEVTVDEMADMIALSGYQTPAIESIGKVQNVDSDGPAAINNNFTGGGSIGYPIEVVITCTWSHELANEWGRIMGAMAKELGSTGWYAPAMNTHRSAFTARNYEYFSEDGVLAGYMAADAVAGALTEGVYSTIKHFAMYDCNGKMVCAWATEQSMREIYLKPFEIAVKVGGATGVMESWAYIGNIWVGECSALNKTILRDEWGFRGFIVSDFFRNNGHGFMNADEALANGVDAMLSTFAGGPNQVTDKTAASNVKYMREATHNILYTTVNSWAYDSEHYSTGMEPWKVTLITVDVIAGILILGGAYLIFRKYKKSK
ncbi:MAG: glycoside hydrolase family 3 C-terminal domain-containing protein [Oscillospiraceae bacterium]|nr:glycoside hydrolase family 3 C-terminal domain-containing protein [Oscillospiraceae bacterium]